MYKYCFPLLLISISVKCQHLAGFADSIRTAYHIPALGYAILSADSVYEIQMLGNKRGNIPATPEDKFRIGSNTKAITGFIAALLVKEGKIRWNTKVSTLLPTANPAYRNITLQQLLSFRAPLVPYTYTNEEPAGFAGNEDEQRIQFANWLLEQPPVASKQGLSYTNAGYVVAGAMLEKASGKTYKQLVKDLGNKLGIRFGFGNPNETDSTQTWGHDAQLVPEPPQHNYKLEWLLVAGNINISLPDYVKFIQLQLKGLKGETKVLPQREFHFLLHGLPTFSIGWFWEKNEAGDLVIRNTGNPGTFITQVYIQKGKAFIFFTNCQTKETYTALDRLFEAAKEAVY
ncbi:serine hydrolase domain-containing protein [Chitinophaga niabensis]|uniref:CubicO group peptidase, beta-lactamase class C family n=1 Tax=Chitinophaga niabensis TaxID=536979 RepID=A0A1N6K3R3_9BACT|nr:serine hydrolase domain-containing protein [Chitinophaga niabensis]SIO51180.1 CubicO group peptidase, beta-lactamase class C family [Chitinophaga niabensis]